MEAAIEYRMCEKRNGKPRINQEVCKTCPEDCEFAESKTEALAVQEKEQLTQLEEVIEKNLRSFYEVGSALLIIRDQRLYRETHATFKDYCQDRWDMGINYAEKLMRSSKTVKALESSTIVPPRNEAQIRPLTKLEPEQQKEVWQKAVETAPDGKVTARHVEMVVEKLNPKWRLKESDTECGTKPLCTVTDAMSFATMAISQLERIRLDDPKRERAFDEVEAWIKKNRMKEV